MNVEEMKAKLKDYAEERMILKEHALIKCFQREISSEIVIDNLINPEKFVDVIEQESKYAGIGKFKRGYSDEELLAEMAKVRNALGHLPSFEEMWHSGGHSPKTYKNHFGSWKAAKRTFEYYENPSKILSDCRDDGIEYTKLRGMVEEFVNNRELYQSHSGISDEMSMKYLEFIRDYFKPLCRRMKVKTDMENLRIEYDGKDEMNVLRVD